LHRFQVKLIASPGKQRGFYEKVPRVVERISKDDVCGAMGNQTRGPLCVV